MWGMLRKFYDDNMNGNSVSGVLFTVVMLFLTLLEFALSGLMFEYTPRFDIVYMSLLSSRKAKIPCFPLLCIGIFRDVIYMLPVMSSAVLCVFVGAVLNHYKTETPGGCLKAMTVAHSSLWIVNCVMYREAASVKYLIFQVFICTAIAAIAARRAASKNS